MVSQRIESDRTRGDPGRGADSKPHGLEPIRIEFKTPRVSEEAYREIREAVGAIGMFIAPIRPVSIAVLLKEDRDRSIWESVPRRFDTDWVMVSENILTAVPPGIEVFFDPEAVRIEGSNNLSTDAQKRMIRNAEARLRRRLPKEVRPFINLRMVDPSTTLQLEDAYMDRKGEFLFPGFYVRTDIPPIRIAQGRAAEVGRGGPYHRRQVTEWSSDFGYVSSFAFPVGVLPQQLVA